jgi:hypothetical protein
MNHKNFAEVSFGVGTIKVMFRNIFFKNILKWYKHKNIRTLQLTEASTTLDKFHFYILFLWFVSVFQTFWLFLFFGHILFHFVLFLASEYDHLHGWRSLKKLSFLFFSLFFLRIEGDSYFPLSLFICQDLFCLSSSFVLSVKQCRS